MAGGGIALSSHAFEMDVGGAVVPGEFVGDLGSGGGGLGFALNHICDYY
jgi:hypothetical protein